MEMDVQFSQADAYNDVEGNRKHLNDGTVSHTYICRVAPFLGHSTK